MVVALWFFEMSPSTQCRNLEDQNVYFIQIIKNRRICIVINCARTLCALETSESPAPPDYFNPGGNAPITNRRGG